MCIKNKKQWPGKVYLLEENLATFRDYLIENQNSLRSKRENDITSYQQGLNSLFSRCTQPLGNFET